MYRYILKRILYAIPVLLGVTIIVYVLINAAPGDPTTALLGNDATPEAIAQAKAELGLNRPYLVRLLDYIKDVFLHFDFGISYRTKIPVIDEVLSRLPVTLKLTFISMGIGSVLGIAAGIISAVKQYSWIDNITTVIALFGISVPSFWLALMMVVVFSVNLGWFPPSGSYGVKYYVLPCVTLGLQAASILMRMTRSSMLEVIRQDYINTARAKGQSEFVVVMKHALRNALIPIITAIGNQTSMLIGGSVLVETVFALPGLGKYIIDSINYRDYPAVIGTIIIISMMTIVIMLVIDIIYGFVDPRIKATYKRKKGTVTNNGQE